MSFQINNSKAISQAEEIRQNAKKLSNLSKLLSLLEQECQLAWSGEAAEAFLKKLHTMQLELRRSALQMESLAQTINERAMGLQNTDQQTAEKVDDFSSSR